MTVCPPSQSRAESVHSCVRLCVHHHGCMQRWFTAACNCMSTITAMCRVGSPLRVTACPPSQLCAEYPACDCVSPITATCRAESPACDWVSTIMATCRVGSLPKNPLGPPVHPSRPSLATTDLFTVSTVLLFPVYRGGEIPQYTAFTDCPLSLCNTHFRLFHVFSGLGSSFLFSSE